MGLFDKLLGSKEERDQKRLRDLIKKSQEKYGEPQARQKALEQLREIGTPEAISALLLRFTVRIEQGIVDSEEKQRVHGWVVAFGGAAIEPVKDFLRTQDQVSWGVRCLKDLVSEDEVTTTVLGALERVGNEFTRNPEKKVVFLNELQERRDPRIVPAVIPFLEDPADDVKVAAIGVLLAQQDPAAHGPIYELLLSAEAPRVRAAAASALAEVAFVPPDRRELLQGKLPEGVVLEKDGPLRRR